MPRVSRFTAYGMLSTGLAAAVVGSALKTRPNFFAAAVSVGRSSGSLMVLANFVLFISVLAGVGFKNIFFGELRPVEYEHLFERLKIFLTESLFALTIFRGDFSMPFAILYDFLIFLKCFHWIAADRVEYIDQVPPPGPPMGFHIRIVTVTSLLTMFDALLFIYSAESVLVDGPTAMILFASEFAILLASVAGTWARYIVGIIDLRRARGRADAPAWEEKSMYLFYVDLVVDFAKLLTYLIFFVVIFLNYGFPVHILRDVYMTLRSFIARGTDLIRYRQATRNMDQLYPDATPEELDRMGDKTCIICREEMVARAADGEPAPPADADGPNETPKKLACGHVFHFHCLRSWLERQQSCPTCRRDVLGRPSGSRNRDPAPPPEAADQAAPGAARGANGEQADGDRMRAMFEDYFRLPQVNGDGPLPVPIPAQAAQGEAGQRSASAPPVTDQAETRDQRVQRSIWGAPITPGRFLTPPLGSAGWSDSAPLRPPRTPTPGGGSFRAEASAPVSGTTTPFSSRPPQVFSSTGVARKTPEKKEEERAAAEVVEIESDDDSRPNDDDLPLREALAAAALRRAGFAADKGKGKAVGQEPEQPQPAPVSFDAPPTHRAFITPASPFGAFAPHASASNSLPRTPEAARAALDERLRALRGVDEVVWSLVGELSRLKSAWEAEDGVEQSQSQGQQGDDQSQLPRGEGSSVL